MYPVPGMKFYELSGKGPIQPPVVTVKGGRPQKERKKDGNDTKDPTKASRKGHMKTCSKCLGEGHNYLTCKNPVNKCSKFYKRIRASQARVSDCGGSQPSHTSQSSQASQAPIRRKLPVWQSKQQKSLHVVTFMLCRCHHHHHPKTKMQANLENYHRKAHLFRLHILMLHKFLHQVPLLQPDVLPFVHLLYLLPRGRKDLLSMMFLKI